MTDSIFNEGNRLGRDKIDGWFTFTTVGDKVEGEIIDMFESAAKDNMPAQRVFTLQTEKEILNVGLKRTDYILGRTNMLQIGDSLGVKFEKEVPSKTKGHSPAKSMAIYTKLNGDRTMENAGRMVPVRSEADKNFDEDTTEESSE